MITIPQMNRLAKFLYGKALAKEELDILSPETFYFGLSSIEIGADGVISGELNNDSYARVAVANDTNNFESAGDGVMQNKKSVKWPTAGEDWGTIKSVFIGYNATPVEGETALYVAPISLTVLKGASLYYDGKTLKLSVEAGEET